MPSEIDNLATPGADPPASGAASGCHGNAVSRLRRSVARVVARAMGAPLWACAVLAALGLVAALLLALH